LQEASQNQEPNIWTMFAIELVHCFMYRMHFWRSICMRRWSNFHFDTAMPPLQAWTANTALQAPV
jgi:hypothetical protein